MSIAYRDMIRRPSIVVPAFMALLLSWFYIPYLSLRFRPPIFAEAAYADYAVHGESRVWSRLIPPAFQQYRDAYGMGAIPGYMLGLRLVFSQAGIGIWQTRLAAFCSGILQFAIFLFIVHRLRMPTSVFLIGAMYCTFPLYADSLGLGRPDNVVFAIGAVNLAWGILNGGNIFGCLAGFLAVSALAIHPQGIFLIVVMPIVLGILRGWRQWLEPRWVWWGLGACAGALLWIPQVDGDQLGRYMSLVKGGAVQLPPLLRWWRNPLEILQHAVHLLKPAFDLAGPAGLPFFGLLVATLAMRLRRLGSSDENRRTVTWLTAIYLACYVLMTASPTPQYALAFYPWWILALAFTVYDVFARAFFFDAVDWAILALANLLLWSYASAAGSAMWLVPLFVLIFAGLAWSQLPRRWIWTVGLLVAVVASLDFCVSFAYWAVTQVHHHPIVLFAVIAASTTIVWYEMRIIRMPELQGSSLLARGYVVAVCGFFVMSSLHHGFKREHLREIDRARRDCFRPIPPNAVVLAPGASWLYRPDLQVAALESALAMKSPRPSLEGTLMAMRPDYLVTPALAPNPQDETWLHAQIGGAGFRISAPTYCGSPDVGFTLSALTTVDRPARP